MTEEKKEEQKKEEKQPQAEEPSAKAEDKKNEKEEAPKVEEKEETPSVSSEKVPSMEPEKEEEQEEVEIPKKFEKLVENIENLSVLELSELVKILEKKFGVSAAVPMAVAPAAGATSAQGDGESDSGEKSAYNIVLKGVGESKIEVIKAVRNITGKGLKEAKDLVDAAINEPQVIKEGAPSEEAKEAQKALQEAGAEIDLQ